VNASPPDETTGTSPPDTAQHHRRLLWLDALRGVAALVVVFEHILDALLPEVRRTASPWFDFGRYGVFVFFIVSGYVVPASLERRGSVREFWIGRIFRLYPLWAVAGAIGLVFAVAEVFWGLPRPLSAHPWTSALAHLTMLQDLLGVPNILNVFWTLSYEMVFYLLVTAMFVLGGRGAGPGTALGFALATVTLGVALPTGLLSAGRDPGAIAGVSVSVLAGLTLVLMGREAARRCGVVLLAAIAIVLLALNSRVGAMESFSIMATMFAGAWIYRIRQGGPGRRRADRLVLLVPLLTIAAGAWLASGQGVPAGHAGLSWGWPAAVAAAWLTFGIALALRHHRMPRPLPWLGLISYSVYLLHQFPLQIVRRLAGDPASLSAVARAGWGAVILASVLLCSALAHRWIERPMQRAGRRVVRIVRRRWPDSAAAPRPVPEAPPRETPPPATGVTGEADRSSCKVA
jgi:peptidoglycan/LPS O-acetylase OafA/YrhL